MAPHNCAPTPLVRLDNVSKTYHMGDLDVEVVRHVSLEIFVGEFLVVVGPSGSGKSTLLNILGGLDGPTVGRVWFRDQELTACTAARLARFRRDRGGLCLLVLQPGAEPYCSRKRVGLNRDQP